MTYVSCIQVVQRLIKVENLVDYDQLPPKTYKVTSEVVYKSMGDISVCIYVETFFVGNSILPVYHTTYCKTAISQRSANA